MICDIIWKGGSVKILLVEDDPSVARGMIRLLESLGHLVEHIWTAQEAWNKFESAEISCDLVLSDNDTGYGSITGVELLNRLRRNSSTQAQKFILTSGRDKHEGRPLHDICQELGAEFAPKPVSLEKLEKLFSKP
jgi:CheY-like chemotaxis protein